MGKNKKYHRTVLSSPQTTETNQLKNIVLAFVAMRSVGLTKLLCAINHAREDLQQRSLVLQMLHCHVKMERVRKDKGTRQNEKREKQRSNGNLGWQDGGNMTAT